MTRKKGKPVSFDALVKFFIQQHNIPTKKDIDKILDRLDRIDQTLKTLQAASPIRTGPPSARGRKTSSTAADRVLAVIKKSEKGVGVVEIGEETGYDEKKLRNILYRLYKTGKIRRKSRGVYIA